MTLQNISEFVQNTMLKKLSKIVIRSCNKREIIKLAKLPGRIIEIPVFNRHGKHIGYDFVFYNTAEIVKYMEGKNDKQA